MTKELTSLRISELTRQQIDELTGRLKMSMTELVMLAIDRFYRQETSQQQYSVFKHRLVQEDGSIKEEAHVTDERRYQYAVRNLPQHDYGGKPARADFTVWSGRPEDIPAEYLR